MMYPPRLVPIQDGLFAITCPTTARDHLELPSLLDVGTRVLVLDKMGSNLSEEFDYYNGSIHPKMYGHAFVNLHSFVFVNGRVMRMIVGKLFQEAGVMMNMERK